ncbi:hypothetical protein AURDEDRAFT_165965 [Auricularia subglabra TFB-10046 SS5]|nr:hypothetical protein AURDEDRAFT_165965 [Auricularia subglabra TFB-10046 SS5]
MVDVEVQQFDPTLCIVGVVRIMADALVVPPALLEELALAITSVFERAAAACDASSSLSRISIIRETLRDAANAALSTAILGPNAQLSFQDRLPPELWFDIWTRLPIRRLSCLLAMERACDAVSWPLVLVYAPTALASTESTMLPILPRPSLPQLEVLELPSTGNYAWPDGNIVDPPSDDLGLVQGAEPAFPSMRVLHFAPRSAQDVMCAVRYCPNISFLDLCLKHFKCVKTQADSVRSSARRVPHLDLRDVPAHRAHGILASFASPTRPHFSVTIGKLPRIIQAQTWDYGNDSTAATPEDATAGRRLRDTAGNLYRRMTKVTKKMFRSNGLDEAALDRAEISLPSPAAGPAYNGKGLRRLSALFSDLGTGVYARLYSHHQWGADDAAIALHASDEQGLMRSAALQSCDIDAFPELLLHTWQTHLPTDYLEHFGVEHGLFPLLLSTLPEVTPIRSLELLFKPISTVGAGARVNGIPVALEPAVGTRFPNLRVIFLSPRNSDASDSIVIAAPDITRFVNSLGSELPLESIKICRGVVVDDEHALDCLALSIVIGVDPIPLAP